MPTLEELQRETNTLLESPLERLQQETTTLLGAPLEQPRQKIAQDLGGAIPFDPVSQIPPVQEADFSQIPPLEREELRRRIIANPPIQSGLQKVLGGIDVAAETLDRSFPELQHVTRQVRRVARAGVGLASLPGVAIESLALPETAIGEEEAQKSLFGFIPPPIASRGRVVGGFLRGLLKDVAQVPTQLQREAELLIDPKSEFQPTRRENIPLELRTLVELQRQFIGEPTTGEAQLEAVRAGEEEPESLLFGLGISRGISRGAGRLVERAQKVKDRPPTRVGEPTPEAEPFTTRIEEPLTPKQVSEQALKTREQMKAAGETVESIRKVTPKERIPTQLTPEVVGIKTNPPTEPIQDFILNNANIKRFRDSRPEWNELPKKQRDSWMASAEDAVINKYDANAQAIVSHAVKNKRPLSASEQAGAMLRIAELEPQWLKSSEKVFKLRKQGKEDAALIEQNRANIIREEMDVITEGMGGRVSQEIGKAMNIRRNLAPETISTVLLAAEKAKGKRLTDVERRSFEDPYRERDVLRKQLDEMTKKWEAEKAKTNEIAAERVINAQLRGRRTTVKREKSLLRLSDIESKMKALGHRVNDITGASLEALHLVGQYGAELAKIGGLKFGEIVAKVKEKFPEFSRNDVLQGIITKDPKLQGRLRTDATKRVAQLKRQAKLILDIEKAEKGIFEPSKARQPSPPEIKALQKQLSKLRREAYGTITDGTRLSRALTLINELQEHLKNKSRAIRKKQRLGTPEIAEAKEKITELRKIMRAEDKLADLNQQLRTGEFRVTTKPPEVELPIELRRIQVEIKRKGRLIQERKEEIMPPSMRKRLNEVTAFTLTMRATADISGAGRQGMFLNGYFVTDGIIGILTGKSRGQFSALVGAHAKSLKALFSEFTADQIDLSIRNAPHHYLREEAGLFLAERGSKLGKGEEVFTSNWAEKIPYYGQVVKASNRHMTTVLNLLRSSAFDLYLRKFPNATMPELKAWADFVNKASGRGDLGKLSFAANEMRLFFWAPRFAVSRFQTPAAVIKHWKHPRVRKEIAKSLAGTVAIGYAMLKLAELAGAEVSIDPREPDFGRISFGGDDVGAKTFIDIWGGMQPVVRFLIRSGLVATDEYGLTGEGLSEQEKDFRVSELFFRFAGYKVSSTVTLMEELATRETVVGEPTAPLISVLRSVTPLMLETTIEAYQRSGVIPAVVSGVSEQVGFGAATYSPSEGRVRRKIKTLVRDGKQTQAEAMAENWNLLNPENRIVGGRIIVGADTTFFEVAKPKSRKKQTFLRPATP